MADTADVINIIMNVQGADKVQALDAELQSVP
jgi:hypothetical protein